MVEMSSYRYLIIKKTWSEIKRKNYKWKSGNWKKRRILWVFWGNSHISELCEKWIHHDGNYAYARFEELCTSSGEVFLLENIRQLYQKINQTLP